MNENHVMCCGCMACKNICPKQAISKGEDERGFIVPVVDHDKCIECGLCDKVCDFVKQHDRSSNTLQAYSVKIMDNAALFGSTSGGAFTALSDVVLQNGGVVFGAVIDKDFNVRHVMAETSTTRDAMRGSKYVQSDIDDVFPVVRDKLKQGVQVMFVGTPCQCAGINSFLGKPYENLLVVDFLCHGVPGNRMFKEHISFLDKHYGRKTVGFTFRNKDYGWDSYNNVVEQEGGRTLSRHINQVYYSFFNSNLSLRQSCFNCPYRSMNRPSDITIGDFWGIEKLTGHKDCKGVSLVLPHTDKGRSALESCSDAVYYKEYPVDAVKSRISLEPSKPNKKSDKFWAAYCSKGYDYVAGTFFNNSASRRIRFELRKIGKKVQMFFSR